MQVITSRCPECKVTFRVTQNQLEIAEGVVRCGVCSKKFNAEEHQVKEGEVLRSPDLLATVIDLKEEEIRFSDDVDFDALLAEIEEQTAPEPPPEVKIATPGKAHLDESVQSNKGLSSYPETILLTGEDQEDTNLPDVRQPEDPEKVPPINEEQESEQVQEKPEAQPQAKDQSTDKHLPSEDGKTDFPSASLRETASENTNVIPEPPDFSALGKSGSKGLRRLMFLLAIAIIGVLLPALYLYFYIDELPPKLMYHPLTERFCHWTGCSIPIQSDVSLIRSKQLVISSHPTKDNVLLANVVLINQADFPQPFPSLEIDFQDINGQLIAEMRFNPRTYLRGEMAGAVYMLPWQPVRIELELADPGEEAVNYRLIILEN